MKKYSCLLIAILLMFSCIHKMHGDKSAPIIVIPDLNGAWALTEVNGIKVAKEKSGMQIPYIELNTALNSLTGSTGCNRLSGKAIVGDAVVNFENLAATRMFCENAIYETPMLQIMRGSLSYLLENNRLVFTKEGKQVLVFQKNS